MNLPPRNLATVVAMAATCLHGGVVAAQQQPTLVLRNNHEIAFRGPVDLTTDLADGRYAGPGAVADVRRGRAHVVADLAPMSEIALTRRGAPTDRPFGGGPLGVHPTAPSLALRWQTRPLADVSLALVVLPGTTATADDAMRAFKPSPFEWTAAPDGELRAEVESNGYAVRVSARPYGGGWLDVRTTVVGRTAQAGPAYVALVRRVVATGARDASMRFNGRVIPGGDSPGIWEGDFRYVHGVDWVRWTTGSLSMLSVNGFTPVPSV